MLARAAPALAMALVLLPALAATGAADVSVCAEYPFCGYGGTMDDLRYSSRGLSDPVARTGAAMVPDSSADAVLAGWGDASVARFGLPASPCDPQAHMVIEASRKPLTLEPTVTISYTGGWHSDPSLALPCMNGHTHQPVFGEISGGFGGAWSAAQNWGDNGWSISVGAPSNGLRSVSYSFWTLEGDQDTFTGALREWR